MAGSEAARGRRTPRRTCLDYGVHFQTRMQYLKTYAVFRTYAIAFLEPQRPGGEDRGVEAAQGWSTPRRMYKGYGEYLQTRMLYLEIHCVQTHSGREARIAGSRRRRVSHAAANSLRGGFSVWHQCRLDRSFRLHVGGAG